MIREQEVYLKIPQTRYGSVIEDSTNSKKMWDNIKLNLIINQSRPSSIIDNLQVNGKTLHQPVSISNSINYYFCNVPTELASACLRQIAISRPL